MENFTFYSPTKLVFGKDVNKQAGAEIAACGAKRVLLLAGGGSIRKNGVYDRVTGSLKAAGVSWIEVWGVRPNPVLSKVEEAVAACRAERVEAVLAVGGGSVLDSGKAVAAGFYLTNSWDAYSGAAAVEKALPLFAVLTLSATGSEMNSFSVLTNEAETKKWAMGAPVLFPKVSFIDPSAQMTLPWHQTVNGAVDAMAHVMEFYFVGTTEETAIALDEALTKSILVATDRLQENPNDYESRANLAWAATLALNGVSGGCLKGGDWAVHGIEHALSALRPEVAHGAGLGVLFPAWIRYVRKENPPQFRRWAKNIWDAPSIEKGIAKMKARLRKWGAPVALDELGFSKADIPAIAANALLAGPLGQLKTLSQKDIEGILALGFD